MNHIFKCQFCILKDPSGQHALGSLCHSDKLYVYGMRKYTGQNPGIYIDITYLNDIGENCEQYLPMLESQNRILTAERDKTDPILKKEPDWTRIVLVPWEFIKEFETTEQGIFIADMVYKILDDVKYEHFTKMIQDDEEGNKKESWQ